MTPDFDLATYYPVFAYLVLVILFVIGVMIATHTIGPNNKTAVKQMPYESGMDPIGDARQRFDVKFYLVAVMFLVFDVELLFLYPWAVVAYRKTSEVSETSEVFRGIYFHLDSFMPTPYLSAAPTNGRAIQDASIGLGVGS